MMDIYVITYPDIIYPEIVNPHNSQPDNPQLLQNIQPFIFNYMICKIICKINLDSYHVAL